jgi:hypothetical protein
VVGVTNAPIEPSERITLTLKTFNKSNEIWLLASGEEKADVVARPWCITTRCYRPGWCMAPRRRTGSRPRRCFETAVLPLPFLNQQPPPPMELIDDFAPGAAATQTVEGLGQIATASSSLRRSFT